MRALARVPLKTFPGAGQNSFGSEVGASGREAAPELVQGRGARPGRGGDRQPLQLDAEYHEEHDAGHELGHGRQRQSGHRDDPVRAAARVKRGDHAADEAERHHDHERERGQLDRIDQRGPDERLHRRPVGVRGAQVAVQQPAEPASRYRVSSGLSTPSWWSRACTALGAARLPRVARAGSPGRIWPPKNTIQVRSRERQHPSSPRRLDGNVAIAGLLDAGPPRAERSRAAQPSSVLDG